MFFKPKNDQAPYASPPYPIQTSFTENVNERSIIQVLLYVTQITRFKRTGKWLSMRGIHVQHDLLGRGEVKLFFYWLGNSNSGSRGARAIKTHAWDSGTQSLVRGKSKSGSSGHVLMRLRSLQQVPLTYFVGRKRETLAKKKNSSFPGWDSLTFSWKNYGLKSWQNGGLTFLILQSETALLKFINWAGRRSRTKALLNGGTVPNAWY